MSQPRHEEGRILDVEASVRQNAARAGLMAGLLIFFGFFWFEGAVGSPMFLKTHAFFVGTLKLGGLAMVGVAVWSSIGSPAALIADAATCLLVGGAVAISAILFVISGGLSVESVIYLVCGASIGSSGIRDVRAYRELPLDEESDADDQCEETDDVSRRARPRALAESMPSQSVPRRDKDVKRQPARRSRSLEEQRGDLAGRDDHSRT